ncbi:MAG: site-specific integrase [Oscillospiraceae bacterium]|nr:site-specific integrase [Oscillospiraceae bacterium]
MASAKKLPSGNWRIQVYAGKDENGKNIMKSFTAPTKREAEAMAALYAVQRKEEKNAKMTVGQAIDSYINMKENILSPSTIGGYRITRKNHIQGLMNTPLEKLTNAEIQREFNEEAKRLSPKTLRNAHGLLSAALAMYMPDFTLHTTLPARQNKIKNLPTPEEVIKAVKGTRIELPVLLSLWLSLRMSEVRGIRYKDIDGNMLTIQNTKIKFGAKEFEREQTKTYKSTRVLEVPERIMQLIGTGEPDEYVIKLKAQTITKILKRIIKDKTGKDMTFHDLRHLNASVMLELGVPEKYAMERGGWSSAHTLQTVYQHTFSEKRKSVDKQIDDYFNALISHEISHE